ncbi:MAG: DoxX family protein [Candidatus Marinimicrobia bacterium]|jgi:putative oxidoreductase|nr:DoxX family protein [Candidatus Neomarinimicrobiota bacterium]MBT3576553.1 DoxX family protein [Candidatus Neomarinimicrobiota bacterium]MBT3680113.1 DoxX family protein [Candidatus Neomarinimicrobiota bacterium]MBT3951320.1 DoxX family protein [Candidatus Neomarinimicrobiota bacterium]MBT4253065.1 DoxX family protein [Candidatus Neomarinimicrobiota bacterium]
MSALTRIAEEHGHWIIRLQLATIFIFHGVIKIPMAEMMSQGMGMPIVGVYMLAVIEVLAGLGFLAGPFLGSLITRISGAITAVVMFSAIAMVHWPQWSFVASEAKAMGGMEFQLLVLLLGALFALRGNELLSAAGSASS